MQVGSVLSAPDNKLNQKSIKISHKEKEVLQLICKEYSNAEIAEKLFISVRTIEGHRNDLLAKTGCYKAPLICS